ncbi:protein of unknown function [Paenibacillus sp. 1_12]|nr:protein of unknown function [Paenibacillus sp. 1_12]
MKKVTIAAVGLAVTLFLGTYVAPTFANDVNSFFNSTENIDSGMKKAYNEGFVKPLDLKVTDQGITIEVKEVLADTMRIVIICQAKDQEGNPIDLDPSYLQFIIKDGMGNPSIDPIMGGWRTSKRGHQLMVELALTKSNTVEKKLPDKVNVELNWKQINETSGDWMLNIPIDMAKAKAVTKTVEINKQYTTPQGLMIDLKRIELAPSLMLLSLETKSTPALYQQKEESLISKGLTVENKPGEPSLPFMLAHEIQEYKLAYELLDQQGNIVAAWDEISDRNLSKQKNTINEMSGGYKWLLHAFAPLTEKPEQLMFKLRAIYSKELADFNVKLKLDDLNKVQIDAKNKGSKFTFSNFSLKEDEKVTDIDGHPIMGKGGIVHIQAELAEHIVGLDVWQAKDENGKEYKVRLEKQSTVGDDGKVSFQGVLVIEQLLEQPKELTLSYHISEIQHRDVSWEESIDLNPLTSTVIVNDRTEGKAAKELKPELQSTKSQPESQQAAQQVPQMTVNDDEAIKKNIEATLRLKYMSIKDLKKNYNIDFIVHNAVKNKYGVYKMAFYDLKSQRELYVIDFVDLEYLEQFGTNTGSGSWQIARLSDGLYVSIDSLKKNGIIQ